MRKKIAGIIAICLSLTCFSGCDISSLLGGVLGSEQSSSSALEDEIVFEQILKQQEKKTIAAGKSVTFNLNEDISGQEYIRMTLNTNVSLLGTYKYSNVNDASQVAEEEFFIEASNGEIVFKQFFDAFRPTSADQKERDSFGCLGAFDKVLKTITFKNVEEKDGELTLKNVEVANRMIPEYEKELYIQKGYLKAGADLACGGALTYLERLSYNGETIDEVLDNDGNVYIGVNAKEDCQKAYSSSVNLINTFDPGRQFQQSYYANVGGLLGDTAEEVLEYGLSESVKPSDYGANGYNRGWVTTAGDGGHYWPYNPVQGGNSYNQTSQIIDYEVSENEIYVKVRAMDWGIKDVPTKSYMENWYTIKGNMLYVTNRFIDWNGFVDLENVPAHSQELPASYVVQPLNHYVCYKGDYPWEETEDTNLDIQAGLTFWGAGSYASTKHLEDWFAWVNKDMFGVGVYVPNTLHYASGRVETTTSSKNPRNKNAKKSILANERRYNKREATYDQMSCYVSNTNYTAPVVSWRMRSYEPISYQYVMSVDYLSVMRSQFKGLFESGVVKNEELSKWR